MPVVSKTSMEISPSRKSCSAVATTAPERMNISGFWVLVTRSLLSPSRPMEVSPSLSPAFSHSAIRELSTVVLPAFLHMPMTESVFMPLSSSYSMTVYLQFFIIT